MTIKRNKKAHIIYVIPTLHHSKFKAFSKALPVNGSTVLATVNMPITSSTTLKNESSPHLQVTALLSGVVKH